MDRGEGKLLEKFTAAGNRKMEIWKTARGSDNSKSWKMDWRENFEVEEKDAPADRVGDSRMRTLEEKHANDGEGRKPSKEQHFLEKWLRLFRKNLRKWTAGEVKGKIVGTE